jgi:hypothetical protein
MNHLSEEQLILYYYSEGGETPSADRHLEECAQCRAAFGALLGVLEVLNEAPAPEPSEDYGAQVWRRIEGRLPARRNFQPPAFPWRWAVAGAAFAGLLVAAFLAGRFYQHARPSPAALAAADAQANERVLLVAVGDYLERSQMVLIELANADPRKALDISTERERASGLVSESRLYRQTAAHAGDTAVASVLDELDRVLLDIAHAPSRLSPADLERLRQRFEAEGILFKIRVLGSNVRQGESGQKL